LEVYGFARFWFPEREEDGVEKSHRHKRLGRKGGRESERERVREEKEQTRVAMAGQGGIKNVTETNGVKEKIVSGKNSFASGLAPKKRSLRKDDGAGMCFSFSPFFLLCKFPFVVRSLNLQLLSLPLELGLENNHSGGEWS
jgi:hypothetical protein